MTPKLVLAWAAWYLLASPLLAAVMIQVTDHTGKPVSGAKVWIATHPKRDGIEEGTTDKQGNYVSKALPNGQPKVWIEIHPKPGSGLEPKADAYNVPANGVIPIRLRKTR